MSDLISGALAGDEAGFAELVARHRRELHVHCYRMLASFDEAEDAVQETLLRGWRHRESFDGSTLLRAWLYRIATNVCLDMLRSRSRHPVPSVGPTRRRAARLLAALVTVGTVMAATGAAALRGRSGLHYFQFPEL